MNCPDVEVLEARGWTPDVTAHVGTCGSCKLVMELIDERSQAAASIERRAECARFEALIAVRVNATLHGAAATLLEEHLHECTDCRALASTMAPVEDAAADHPSLPAIDTKAYALGSEVARGGMGRIIAARDLRIGRPVAVKELLAKNASLAARFEREARVTARLQHPGIVPIYEIGTWENGTPFYAMRMVAGKTLRAALADKPLEARLALLPSVLAAAEAVAFAHAHQVIHRDLTPSNILVGEFGETVVIDWGLAKDLSTETADDADVGPYRRDPNASPELTAAGAIIGTASYMPPEQAAGERVDARADVYALGAILYHLLAGHTPYKGTLENVLRAVKTEPPAPLPAATPRDLASIVSKAMSRDPAERYPSAKELAAELAAFQAGRLVGAHEYTRGELVRRFVRRNKGVLAAVGVAMVVLATLGTFAVRRIIEERDDADDQRAIAEQRRSQSDTLSVTLLAEQGRQELLAGHPSRALPYLSAAYSQGDASADTRFMIAAAMHETDAREHVLRGLDRAIQEVAFSNDGERLAVVKGDTVEVWDLASGSLLATLRAANELGGAVFSPDAKRLVAYSDDQQNRWPALWLFDLATNRRFKLEGHTHSSTRPMITRDSKYLISVSWDGTWRRWDIADPAHVTSQSFKMYGPPLHGKAGPVGAGVPAVDDAGERLLTISWNGAVAEVWNIRSGERITKLDLPKTYGGTLSPDGTRLLSCDLETAILWDLASGRQLARREGPPFHLVRCMFRADGAILLAGDRSVIELWDAALAHKLAALTEGPGLIDPRFAGPHRLAVPNNLGRMNVTVWDPELEAPLYRFEIGSITRTSLDGRRLATTRDHGSVEVLRLDRSRLVHRFTKADMAGSNVDLDGTTVVAESTSGSVTIHDLARGNVVLDHPPLRKLYDIAGRRVAAQTPEGDVLVIDARSGATIQRISPREPPVFLQFAAAGEKLLIAYRSSSELRDVATGRVAATIPVAGLQARVSSDAARVVVLVDKHHLIPWDVATGKQLPAIELADPILFELFFPSADGTRLGVTCAHAKAIEQGMLSLELYDLTSGKRLASLPNATLPAFTPHADRMFAVALDGTIFVVRASDGVILKRHPGEPDFGTVQVTADGTRLATAKHDGVSEIRSVVDGRPLYRFPMRPPIPGVDPKNRNFGYSLTLAGNGFMMGIRDDLFVVGNENGSAIAAWDIHLETRSPPEIAKLVDERVPWRLEGGKLVRRDFASAP